MTAGAEGSLTAIIGAGPAGLTAAWELARLGRSAVVFEKDDVVGGISRTVQYGPFRLDIGGHRFFTQVEEVQRIWEELMGDDFLVRPRLSRIHYRGHFFDYPLRPVNALVGLGPWEALRIVASYAKSRAFPHADERTFDRWVSNRFGTRLFEIFFKTYTEKVWGMPCSEIDADWAAQRIKNLDLLTAVKNALFGSMAKGGGVVTTLIDEFQYPRLGPGMMWERCRDALADQGIATELETPVVGLRHDGQRVLSVQVEGPEGSVRDVEANDFVSSMPMPQLLRCMDPPPPPEVLEAAAQLRFRDFLTVGLVVAGEDLFPDNWIYVHSPDVRLGRVQNFANWSPEMVPEQGKSFLGLEYFVNESDELWSMEDADLVELGRRELDRIGLVGARDVEGGVVVRMPKAYPVYDGDYKSALATIRPWLDRLENLQLIGRNGQHRYNNQDHSMLCGLLAARNIDGASHDVWDVNVEAEYHEGGRRPATGDRQHPAPAGEVSPLEFLQTAFAKYDPLALGVAMGSTLGSGFFAATAVLLLKGGGPVGPNLSLLGQYFLGYEVTWQGAGLALIEAGLGGFALGWLLARSLNAVIDFELTTLQRRLEQRTLDPLEWTS